MFSVLKSVYCSTHVNVISGTNGSGKSAVLQAIQNCLGVKARDTGRGDSMKDFVRKGSYDCKVQVGDPGFVDSNAMQLVTYSWWGEPSFATLHAISPSLCSGVTHSLLESVNLLHPNDWTHHTFVCEAAGSCVI